MSAEQPAALSAKAEQVLRIARSIGGPFTRADCGIPRGRRSDAMSELHAAGLVEPADDLRDGYVLWRLTAGQPRVWPMLAPAPDDLGRVEVWTDGGTRILLVLDREPHGRWSDKPGTPFPIAYTWGELLELGEVREVLS